MAPTCQNVPLEFKCILFNRQKKPGAPGARRLWAFFSRRARCSSPPSSVLLPVLLRILVNYARLPPAHRALHDSTSLRRSLFFHSKRWTRRLFQCELKACRERSCVFRWDQPEKRRRNIPVRRVGLLRRPEYFGAHSYFARRPVCPMNCW